MRRSMRLAGSSSWTEYRTEGETRAAEAMAAPPPDAGTRRALRKLVDKWDAEAGGTNDGGGGAVGGAAGLFRNWLALRETEYRRGQDDEEVERLTDEMIAIERAILAADPATAEDEQAQVAILAYYAVHEAPYANYEVLDRCYQRLVIDRLSDPIVREREREWGRKRVERAREKLSETD